MSDPFGRSAQPDAPPTELGRLRILSSTSGLRVSPLALGGGNLGQAWEKAWGVMTKERAFELLDAYFDVSTVSFCLSFADSSCAPLCNGRTAAADISHRRAAISSTPPIRTRTASLKPGSANG